VPTAHTDLTIYNGALDIISEQALTATNVSTPEARWLNRNYAHYREMALRANLWSFSIELHDLSADGGYTAAAGWAHRYSWPNNAIRMIRPTQYGRYGYPLVHIESRGNKIYSNWEAPLTVRFVMNESDPGEWDPLFAEVIMASLAEGMCQRFVRKNTYLEIAMQRKQNALDTAEQIDAFEADMEPMETHDIIRAREL
jgi:hypothetical protein